MKIKIEKFKKIEEANVELAKINIFIGTNNSGKSSFIQAIQFAISSGQTLQILNARWVKGISRTLGLDSTDFLYAPTRFIEDLYHGKKLTGSKTRKDRKHISFKFEDGEDKSIVQISRGKNGGFTTTITGKSLGEKLCSIETPFCVYVPGIAGIPVQEKYEVPIAIKKSATRGDSNNYLRNIILDISKDSQKWNRFTTSINKIYTDVNLKVTFDGNKSEFISVDIESGGHPLPIDSIGTGLLQTIQVFAYIEYFNPTLLLLDEPDAHIHPTKQKLLAFEILDRTKQNENLKVVFSTHSRYILEILDGQSKVFYFQNGVVFDDVKESKILLDIGAADADYLFSKKNLKYIIVTEDKVDNIAEKKEFLKKFILINGLQEDEFVFHSYEGCTKVDFAKILQGFVSKQIPTIKVIVHFDRDQRVDSDTELIRLQSDCTDRGIELFITEYSEIENYFCQPLHISQTYDMALVDAEKIYEAAIIEVESLTKSKLSNFILRLRPEFGHNSNGKMDIEIINSQVTKWYDEYKYQLSPGKELLGKIKKYIQEQLKDDPQKILNVSEGLISGKFRNLIPVEDIPFHAKTNVEAEAILSELRKENTDLQSSLFEIE